MKPSANNVTFSEGLIFNNLSKKRKSYTQGFSRGCEVMGRMRLRTQKTQLPSRANF